MGKRPDISVILVANRNVVRADFGKNPSAPIFRSEESVDVETSIDDAVRQVAINDHADDPSIAFQTIVVWTEVWSQLVSLPRLSLSGIEPSELEEILKFEAETLSGIEIDEISLAFQALGSRDEFQQFWVSAIRKSELDSIIEALESAGCRETIVAHPAGLSGDSDSAKEKIEVWEELAYFTSGYPGKLTRVKQALKDSLNAELVNGKQALLLGSSVDEFDPASTPDFQDLAEEPSLDRWAAQVANNCLKNSDNLNAPLIKLNKGVKSTPVRHLISFGIAAAMLMFCFWHWNLLRSQTENMRAKIVEIQKPASEKKKHDSKLIEVFEKRAKIEVDDTALTDDLKRIEFFLNNQNDRFAKLLQLLVELRTDKLVIQEIGSNEEGVSISGVSLIGESAQALAKQLREKAVPLGWVVNAARQDGQQKLTTGGPWTFEILLTDTGPFESAAQSKRPNPTPKSKP